MFPVRASYRAILPVPWRDPDLADLLRYVQQSGCSFVIVDCDCIPLADLPILHPEFQDT